MGCYYSEHRIKCNNLSESSFNNDGIMVIINIQLRHSFARLLSSAALRDLTAVPTYRYIILTRYQEIHFEAPIIKFLRPNPARFK